MVVKERKWLARSARRCAGTPAGGFLRDLINASFTLNSPSPTCSAILWATGYSHMTLTPEQCLSLLHQGANELRRGNLTAAGQFFSAAVEAAKTFPKEQSYAILPIATANLSVLASRQGRPEQATQL